MIDRARILSLWRNGILWAGVIVVLAFVVGWPPYQDARIWPDSASYLGFSSARMPVYSLLASTFENHYILVCIQFAISLLCWCWLGWAAARAAGVLVASCFALSAPIVMWNLSVLSESMSLSLLAASLASTITLYRRWTRGCFVAWCALIALFAMTRWTNVLLIPFLVVPFVATNKRSLLYVSVVALVVVVGTNLYGRTVGRSLRTVSIVNVYTGRILTTQERLVYFVERGMPVRDEMGPYVGNTGRKNMLRLFKACPEFAEWFEEAGVSTYYRWLLSQPENFEIPIVTVYLNLNYTNLQYAEGTRPRGVYPSLTWFYAFIHVPWWLWMVGVLVPVLARRLLRRATPDSLLIPALMAAVYAQAYAGYHGDQAEVSRHVFLAMIIYKITTLMAVAAAARILLVWRASRAG
jgi:hypothetical protein